VDYDEVHAIKAMLTEQEVLPEIKQLLEDYADFFRLQQSYLHRDSLTIIYS
jgi:hypothetical protein